MAGFRRSFLIVAAMAGFAALLAASAGARGLSVAFKSLPSRVFEGQTATFKASVSSPARTSCTLKIWYPGKRSLQASHFSNRGVVSWRVRIPSVPPGFARVRVVCAGLGSTNGRVLVEWALQAPKLTVTQSGFTETYDGGNGTGNVSYGLAIKNERSRFDATSVSFLVNFVDAANKVLGTAHLSIGRIPAAWTVYDGGETGVPYTQSDPVARLELVLVEATSSPKVPSTPVLISDVQIAADTHLPPHVDSVRGQLLNQGKLVLGGASLGVVLLNASGAIIGGGTGGGAGPLSTGSREFFSSGGSYSHLLWQDAATALISAVPSYQKA